MKTVERILWIALAAIAGAASATAESLPPPAQVLGTLRRVNDRFLLNWPDPGRDIVTDRARPSNIWTRATYFEGLMALHAIDPDARYYDYAVRWGESHGWQPAYGSADRRHADNQCCGQTYLDLYALDPRPERLGGIKAALDLMVDSTKSDDWWWIDALQMSMPVFTRLGVQLGDTRYFEKMHALYTHTKRTQGGRGLYNEVEHLWWRDADFDPPYLEPNGAHCYWSRGNGWVFAGLARVLDRLPMSDPHRAEYLRDFQDMAAALAPLQRADGFWNVSLKDPRNYGGRELTGTAFFTHGMAWGIRHGHLSRSTYLPVVTRAWRALANLAVRADGTLGYVQGSGKQPSDGQPVTYESIPNFDDFGTGAFLLAGSEVYRIASTPAIDYIGVWQENSSRVALSQGAAAVTEKTQTLRVSIRGTALARAFETAPRVATPGPGGGEMVYSTSEDEWNYTLIRSGVVPDSVLLEGLPGNGSYFVSMHSPIDGIVLAGAPPAWPWPEWNPETNVARETVLASRPVQSGAGAVQTRVHLALTHSRNPGERIEHTTLLGKPSDSFRLTLPPYTLTTGEYPYRFETIHCSTVRSSIDLGSLGRDVTIEGGWRSSMHGPKLIVHEATHSREKLINVSSVATASSDQPAIAGFVISEGGPKMVLIRAVGPGLEGFGVANALPNPYLRVLNENGTRAWQNDDWQSSSQYLALTTAGATALQAGYSNARDVAVSARECGAFPLTARSRDAAMVLVLPPGNYTAQVTPSGGSAPGQALVEVYELATTQTNPRLTNLSARGTVSSVDALTTGFVITGGSKRVLLRGIGPALAHVGVPGAATLRDPAITVFDSAGVPVAQNDNWSEVANLAELTAFRAAVGAFPLAAGSKDSELALTLAPGAYTLRVNSADGGAGMALAEIYTEPPGS